MKHRNKKEKVAISIITRTERSKKNSPRGEKRKGTKHKNDGICRDGGRIKCDEGRESRVELTVIFTVPSDAQAPSLDSWKTKSNGLSQSGGIDVGYSILVANPSVREIEPLPRDVAIGVGSVVRCEPTNTSTARQKESRISMSRREEKKKRTQTIAEGPREDAPSLNKNLFCPVRCAGGGSGPDVRCQFFQSMVGCRPHAHPSMAPRSGTRQTSKCPRYMHRLLSEMLVWMRMMREMM